MEDQVERPPRKGTLPTHAACGAHGTFRSTPVDTNLKNRLPEEHQNDHSDSHEATKDQPKPSWKHPSRQAPGMSAQTGSWEL